MLKRTLSASSTILSIIILLTAASSGTSQTEEAQKTSDAPDAPDEWIRVQTDKGDLSVEVPIKHRYFFNREGFTIGSSVTYKLTHMNQFTAYQDSTLISMEIFKAKKDALKSLYKQDGLLNGWTKKPDTEINGIKIISFMKQAGRAGNIYVVARYFAFNGKIAVMLAASRKGKTDAIERFWNSLSVKKEEDMNQIIPGTAFSKLDRTDVVLDFKTTAMTKTPEKVPDKTTVDQNSVPGSIETKSPENGASDKVSKQENNAKNRDPKNENPLVVITKPFPAYTDPAREENVKGTIRLRVLFEKNGFIKMINILKKLPGGLLRQALFAAIRIRFLPAEINGGTISTIKRVEYSFDLYRYW